MKYIKSVSDQLLVNLQGVAIQDESKKTIELSFKSFLSNLLGDSKFAEDKQGATKILFIVEVKTAIDKMDFSKNYIELENEHYKAIKGALDSSEFNTNIALTIYPFIQAVLNAVDDKPE
jgi:hypothetical protein